MLLQWKDFKATGGQRLIVASHAMLEESIDASSITCDPNAGVNAVVLLFLPPSKENTKSKNCADDQCTSEISFLNLKTTHLWEKKDKITAINCGIELLQPHYNELTPG